VIIPLSKQHVHQAAQLHCASLTGLVSELGILAAKAYYAGFVKAGTGVGFVYTEEDRVLGYVLGSKNPGKLKREVLLRNPAGVMVGLCTGIARRPAALASLVKSFHGPDSGSYDNQAAELTYLVVSKDCRSGGIGRQLVDAFTQAMRDAGVPAYELSVDDDNQPAIGFYERLGFRLIGRYHEFGVLHRRYRLELHADAKR
jgi:ribosomal protein S18 acetylase RimI-like enzyme